jgi:hypothetical protein
VLLSYQFLLSFWFLALQGIHDTPSLPPLACVAFACSRIEIYEKWHHISSLIMNQSAAQAIYIWDYRENSKTTLQGVKHSIRLCAAMTLWASLTKCQSSPSPSSWIAVMSCHDSEHVIIHPKFQANHYTNIWSWVSVPLLEATHRLRHNVG